MHDFSIRYQDYTNEQLIKEAHGSYNHMDGEDMIKLIKELAIRLTYSREYGIIDNKEK